jgi:hypothetical protein
VVSEVLETGITTMLAPGSLNSAIGTATAAPADRRRRIRTTVQWPVLIHDDSGVIETVTRNLSSDGFYCVVPWPPALGAHRACTIRIPFARPDLAVILHCRIRVVRIEIDPEEGRFGMAACIEDYRVELPSGRAPGRDAAWFLRDQESERALHKRAGFG